MMSLKKPWHPKTEKATVGLSELLFFWTSIYLLLELGIVRFPERKVTIGSPKTPESLQNSCLSDSLTVFDK